MDEWIDLLKTFGVAVAILVAIGIGCWRACRWFGQEIVLPVRDFTLQKVDAFFHRMSETMDKVNDSVDAMTANLGEQTRMLQGIEKDLRAHQKWAEEATKELGKIRQEHETR